MTPSNRKTLALSLLCAALSLGAWQSASAAAPKDTLMIGKAADPQTLDPAVTSRMAPTSIVSVTRSRTASLEPAATPELTRVAAVKVAIVEVVDTLMAREPPSNA